MDKFCYVRTLPLKKLIRNEATMKEIEGLVCSTNQICRETYLFIRAFIIDKLERGLSIPTINRIFVRNVISTISEIDSRGRKSTDLQGKEEIVNFFEEKFARVQVEKIKKPSGTLLEYVVVEILTAIENHIKTKFFSYVSKLVFSIAPDSDKKTQRAKIKNDIMDGSFTSEETYHSTIRDFAEISTLIKIFKTKPQQCIPMMYKINSFILAQNPKVKVYSILPLRRSLIPCFITFSKSVFLSIFKDENVWSELEGRVLSLFKLKSSEYSFTSFRTNGVGCSLLFSIPALKFKKKKKETSPYFEDLRSYEEFKGKKIVAIDPNKGNLLYCFDGKKVLRYTQNERRFVSKKTKYKHIRSDIEKDVVVDNMTILENMSKLTLTSSKSLSSSEFLEYAREKSLLAHRFSAIYEQPIYRKLRENVKINLRRSEERFVNKFKKTYGEPENVVVVFGDWEERPAFLRGKEPTKGKSLRQMLRKVGYKVYLLDEFRTSKTCHKCFGVNEYNFTKRNDKRPWKHNEVQKVWGLSRCSNGCGKVHQRDFNSVCNIRYIALSWMENGCSPENFDRHHQDYAILEIGIGSRSKYNLSRSSLMTNPEKLVVRTKSEIKG